MSKKPATQDSPRPALIASFVRPLYRPVNEKQVDNIASSIKARGFDPHFAVTYYHGVDFYSGREGIVVLGGEHRLQACEKNGLTEVLAWEEPAPKNKAEQLRRAMQLNAHGATDDSTLARQTMTYLLEVSKQDNMPKSEDIAADLEVSKSYVVRINAFRKRAVPELVAAWLENRKLSLSTVETIATDETKAQQRKRVCDNNYVVTKKEKTGPLLPPDVHGRVKHIAVVLGPSAADVVLWLTGEREVSEAAFARLQSEADARYAADDAASIDTAGEAA